MIMDNAALIASFLEYIDKLRNYSSLTLNTCKVLCRRWTEFLLTQGIHSVKNAEAKHVLAWIELRQTVDTVCDRTIESELCTLRTFYEYLIAFHGPSGDPCRCLPDFICKPAPEQDYVSVKEVFKMLDTFDKSNIIEYRNYCIVALLWSTGLRSFELRAIKWCDIDLVEGVLLVRKGKGNKQRQLFLNDRILDDLRTYRKKILAGEDTSLFCTYPNSKKKEICEVQLSNQQLLDILHNAARSAGISRRLTSQMLRHSFATHMYEAEVEIADIAEMMGHAHRTETSGYIHVSPKAAKALLNNHMFQTQKKQEGI
jgi:site-specific recombinase XerD